MSGSAPVAADPGAESTLREFRAGLPPEARSGPLDFGSTVVGPDRWNTLVSQEGGNVERFNSAVQSLGGPDATVTQSPILLRDDTGRFGTSTLFQVTGANGQSQLVDAQGATYTDVNDYLENNQFDDSWTMVRPAQPGAADGAGQQLVSGPAHNTTFGQQVGKIGDQIAGPAMIAGGVLVIGASAAGEVGTLGGATPIAAPAAIWGGSLIATGAGWTAARSGEDLFNRYQHGRSLSWNDPQARADYLGLAGAAGGGAGAVARGLGAPVAAAAGDGLAVGSGGALLADQGIQLHNNWENLTPEQRTQHLTELGTGAGLMAVPYAHRAVPKAELPFLPPGTEYRGRSAPVQASKDSPEGQVVPPRPGEAPPEGTVPVPRAPEGGSAAGPVGGVNGVITPGTSPSPAAAQKLVEEAEPVGSGLKGDPYHRSASFAVDGISSRGSVFRISSGGAEKTLIQVPGELNGKAGRFEWIVNDAKKLEHQLFVAGGSINGKPIVQ